jgi:multisubunit Na+/H+ antiporter MnhB subunit
MEAVPENQLPVMRRVIAKVRGAVRTALPVMPALAAGALLRVWMLKKFPQVEGDSLLYGGVAKNLLLHGRYAITDGNGVLHETLLRLPGYPLFLAACFRLFGVDNYNAVAYVQIGMELLGCLLLADFARRIAPPAHQSGAAQATLWLSALCPFTASYAAAPLTETPTLFAIALALWAVGRFHARPGWPSALAFTFAVSFAALLRPDGALVGVALAPAMVVGLRRESLEKNTSRAHVPRLLRMAVVCVLLALVPFAAWTARNWRVFHVFEPLAPRYANDPDEALRPGWQRWVKTWCLDFTSTYDIYWNVPDGPFDLSKLPKRAFDSPAQYAATAALAAEYKANGQDLTPEMDARFARLAEERIAAHSLRYYLWLPLGRLGDMWLRPRVENLPIDMDWWVYAHHDEETRFSWEYAVLNAVYLLLGLAGLCMRPRYWPWMLAYMVLRSGLLMTVEAPETRYTLECFPMLFVLGGIAAYWLLYVVWRSVLSVKALPGNG